MYIGPAFVFKIDASTIAPSSKKICFASPITVFEVDGQGQSTGVGYDSINYTINPGESSKSVVDRPDPSWTDFRANIYEVNGQTSPPLTLTGVYTWDTP